MLRVALRRVSCVRSLVRSCQTSAPKKTTTTTTTPATTAATSSGGTGKAEPTPVTRESCLKAISDVEPVTEFDKKLLVFTRAYKTTQEIPNIIPTAKIRRARDLMRVIIGSIISLAFVIAVPFCIYSGRQARASGDTIAKQKKEWVRQLRAKKLEEEELEAKKLAEMAAKE